MHNVIFVGSDNRPVMSLDVMSSKRAAIGKQLSFFRKKREDILSSKIKACFLKLKDLNFKI